MEADALVEAGKQKWRPLKAIRTKCLDCSGGSSSEVKNCSMKDCLLYPHRFGHRPITVAKKAGEQLEGGVMTATKAIRKKCLDCCGGKSNEVKLCTSKDCPLYSYRFGHKPKEV